MLNRRSFVKQLTCIGGGLLSALGFTNNTKAEQLPEPSLPLNDPYTEPFLVDKVYMIAGNIHTTEVGFHEIEPGDFYRTKKDKDVWYRIFRPVFSANLNKQQYIFSQPYSPNVLELLEVSVRYIIIPYTKAQMIAHLTKEHHEAKKRDLDKFAARVNEGAGPHDVDYFVAALASKHGLE